MITGFDVLLIATELRADQPECTNSRLFRNALEWDDVADPFDATWLRHHEEQRRHAVRRRRKQQLERLARLRNVPFQRWYQRLLIGSKPFAMTRLEMRPKVGSFDKRKISS